MIKTILIFFTVLFIAPNFIDKNINQDFQYDREELFSPELYYINSIQKLEQHTDSLANIQHIAQRSAEYLMLLEKIISKRFYHGFSQFTLKENWLAATGEVLFGRGLACKVLPEEIIQHPFAACSQQVIVMMTVARRKNIDYRSIGFPHHYALELKANNSWYFFDPNLEPVMSKEQRSSINWQTMTGSLKQYYKPTIQSGFGYMFGSVSPVFGKTNADPAPNAALFQKATIWLSRLFWSFPLLILALRNYRLRIVRYGLWVGFRKPGSFSFTAEKGVNGVFAEV